MLIQSHRVLLALLRVHFVCSAMVEPNRLRGPGGLDDMG
jgi:hypothetical protein